MSYSSSDFFSNTLTNITYIYFHTMEKFFPNQNIVTKTKKYALAAKILLNKIISIYLHPKEEMMKRVSS